MVNKEKLDTDQICTMYVKRMHGEGGNEEVCKDR